MLLEDDGVSLRRVDEATANNTKHFIAFVPPACRTAALRLSCLSGFVSCRYDPVAHTLTYYAPCHAVCEDMVDKCSAYLASVGRLSLLPNCSAVDSASGRPLFPATNCNNASQNAVAPYSQADCPYPLKFNPRGTVGDPTLSITATEQICVYPCPDPIFADSDWDASAGITISLGIISFAMMLFLITTMALNPRKRRFPTSFQLWMCVSSLIAAAGLDIAVLVGGPDRALCTWDETPVVQTFDGARENGGQGVVCVLQGMLVMFGGLAGSFWWVMLTYTVFQFLVFEIASDRARRMLHIASHVVCWGMPTILVAIGLGAQQIESRPGAHNCFVVPSWDWGLFYGPVCFNLFVGTALMSIAIAKVLWMRFQLKEQVVRLSVLILCYWLIFAYLIGYRIYLETVLDPITDAVAAQIHCSAMTGDDCPLDTSLNKGAWYLQAFSIGGQGIIIFCCLGLSQETFHFWGRLLKNWRDPLSIIGTTESSHKSSRSSAAFSSQVAGRRNNNTSRAGVLSTSDGEVVRTPPTQSLDEAEADEVDAL